MDVFRFMGMPDKVLAFENLPSEFLKHFEMCRADGFPRHWKEWMGKKKKVTPIPPEKDMLTGGVRRFDPIIEEDSYFYLVDFNLKQNEEKWQKLTDFIRRTVSKDVRLMDKIEDMAKPLANDKSEGVSLNPEDVTIIVLPKAGAKADPKEPVAEPVVEPKEVPTETEVQSLKCDECEFIASGPYRKNSVRFHKQKKHALVKA